MARTVVSYKAKLQSTAYITPAPAAGGGTQYPPGTVIYLEPDYESRVSNRRWPVQDPAGWVAWWEVESASIKPVYHYTTDFCRAPDVVSIDFDQLVLHLSGGMGGDLNDMTGYEVQYRERSISQQAYGEWSAAVFLESAGAAQMPVTVSPGKARQYRARTVGTADGYESPWTESDGELFSSALETVETTLPPVCLHVFDASLAYAGRVENWISMTWEEEYQGEGAFTLEVPDTDRYARLLRRGCFFYRADRRTLMVAVEIERRQSRITVGGYTALHLMNHRVVYNRRVITNIEEGIYRMINSTISGEGRDLPIVTAAPRGYEDSVEEEIFDCVMMNDAVFTLIREGDLGMRATFDPEARQITYEVYRGSDRTYGTAFGQTFSTELGNLYEMVVVEDDDMLKNVAVVAGANPGCHKTTFTYEAAEGLTGLARRELLVPGEPQGTTGEVDDEGREIKRSHEQWKKDMLDRGKQALTDYNLVQTFEVAPDLSAYGRRYALGDLITCQSARYGLRFDARITQVRERFGPDGRRITMTLGKPRVNYIQKELTKFV